MSKSDASRHGGSCIPCVRITHEPAGPIWDTKNANPAGSC